ncbi:hypothetical protein ACHAWF_007714 [Thalassiosira exigua]
MSVQQKQVSAIGPGIVALVGLHLEDTESDLQFCSKRLLALKLFENDSGTFWRQQVKQKGYEILCVSQFTLYGTLSKKNQPDYSLAMKADQAKTMYHRFLEMLKEGYADEKILDVVLLKPVEVGLVDDGPVTLVIDSREGMERKMSSMSLSNDGE